MFTYVIYFIIILISLRIKNVLVISYEISGFSFPVTIWQALFWQGSNTCKVERSMIRAKIVSNKTLVDDRKSYFLRYSIHKNF